MAHHHVVPLSPPSSTAPSYPQESVNSRSRRQQAASTATTTTTSIDHTGQTAAGCVHMIIRQYSLLSRSFPLLLICTGVPKPQYCTVYGYSAITVSDSTLFIPVERGVLERRDASRGFAPLVQPSRNAPQCPEQETNKTNSRTTPHHPAT